MCIRDLGIEFDKLELAENVDSAQAATATSHEDWLDISFKKSLSDLLSSDRARKELKSMDSNRAFGVYYKQGE